MITTENIIVTYDGEEITSAHAPHDAQAPCGWARDGVAKIDDVELTNRFTAFGYPRCRHVKRDGKDGAMDDIRIATTGEDAVAWLSPSMGADDEAGEPIGPHMRAWAPSGTIETANLARAFHGYRGRHGLMIAGERGPGWPGSESELVMVGFPFLVRKRRKALWQVIEGEWRLTYLDFNDRFHARDLGLLKGYSPLVELTYRPGQEQADWTQQVADVRIIPGYQLDLRGVTTGVPQTSPVDPAWRDATLAQLKIVGA